MFIALANHRVFATLSGWSAGTLATIEYNAIDFKTIPAKRQYRVRIKEIDPDWCKPTKSVLVKNQTEFFLEKYLEDFIVTNFDNIFKDELALYIDPQEKVTGQQYATDVGIIDVLAQEPSTNSFVVIKLKKGRESDKVIGQVLRYMGWVSENLCKDGQLVKGLIICRDTDIRLSYALKTISNVTVKYYQVDFRLSDIPFKKHKA